MATGWVCVEVYFDSPHCASAGQVEAMKSVGGKRTEVQVLLLWACFWLYAAKAYCQDGTRAKQTKLIPEY